MTSIGPGASFPISARPVTLTFSQAEAARLLAWLVLVRGTSAAKANEVAPLYREIAAARERGEIPF